jgi:hypothetical protein
MPILPSYFAFNRAKQLYLGRLNSVGAGLSNDLINGLSIKQSDRRIDWRENAKNVEENETLFAKQKL